MSEPNWPLISSLSTRFDHLVGIASQDQLRRLLDNFHVVSLVASGKLDDILNSFFVAKTQDPASPGRLLEQLRHYELAPGRAKFLSALLEASGIVCDDPISRQVVRKYYVSSGPGEGMRCKLVRFDAASVSVKDVRGACQGVGLAPAKLSDLVQFADEYPDAVPDRLLGAGSTVVLKRAGQPDIVGVPVIARRGEDRRLELSLQTVPDVGTRSIDGTAVFLAERVPLRDATDDTELLADDAFPA